MHKIREWALRYGPAEIVTLLLTIAPSWLAFHFTDNRLVSALAGTWGGTIGYFGTIFLQEVLVVRRQLRAKQSVLTTAVLLKIVRALIIEFGFTEILDSFVIRPWLMYKLPMHTADYTTGVIAAHFIGAITFYLPSIMIYEWSKKRYRQFA